MENSHKEAAAAECKRQRQGEFLKESQRKSSSPEPPYLHPESSGIFFGYCASPRALERFNWTVSGGGGSGGGLEEFNRQFDTDLNRLVHGYDCDQPQNWLFDFEEKAESGNCSSVIQIYPHLPAKSSSTLQKSQKRKPPKTPPELKREYNRRYKAKKVAEAEAKQKQVKKKLSTKSSKTAKKKKKKKAAATSTRRPPATKKVKPPPPPSQDRPVTRSSRFNPEQILEYNRRMVHKYRC